MPDTVLHGQMVTTRRLPPEEWGRLREIGPFCTTDLPLPDPEHAMVMAIEEDGVLIGYWFARDTVLLEGMYLHESVRHRISTAKAMIFGMVGMLREAGISEALTVSLTDEVSRLAKTAGFNQLAGGSLHQLRIGGA